MATGDDADLAADLYRAALDECREQRGGSELAAESPAPEDVPSLCSGTGGFVVLGAFDGYPAGLAVVELADEVGGPHVILRCLFVDRDLRRVGVGEAILAVVEEESARAGSSRVDVPVLPGSLPAKAFFETAGYRTRRLTMAHRLGE